MSDLSKRDFQRLDSDQDGRLSKEEVRNGLRSRGLPASKQDVDTFFERADENGDGHISTAEYDKWVALRVKEIRAVYNTVDENGDGRLTTDELRAAAKKLGFTISHEQLRGMFKHANREHDGVISFDDFCSYLLLLPTVNPAAVFEALEESSLIDYADGQFSPPAEAVGKAEHSNLLAVLLSKVYSGSVAGGISRTATAPIDRVKTIMQAAPPGEPSGGLVKGMQRIHAEGGFMAFFRGNTANVVKIAPETSIKFLAFDFLKTALAEDAHNVTVSERFVAGGSAGAIAQAAIYPLEICKTRIAVAAAGTYSGLFDCVSQILRAEGPMALYQGLTTSIVGIVPYAGVDLSINSLLKDVTARWYKARGEEPGVTVVLSCGMLSSTCAMLMTYPLNLVRTRLQASGMPGAPSYSGPLDVVKQAIRGGGIGGLYQGILPNMLKVLPATSISYAVYDYLAKK